MESNNFLKLIIAGGVLVLAVYLGYSTWQFNETGQIACTLEAKLCSDGSAVGRSGPNCEFAACPKEDLIQVELPRANETISSPLTVRGKARGPWFFEATFPVALYDEAGNLLVQSYATAAGEWMTTEFVPFSAVIEFNAQAASRGFLVLERDNPSGLPENADELRVPVVFSSQENGTRAIKLYFYNSELDKDAAGNILCSRKGLAAVERKIPISRTPIQDSIKLLLSGGLTAQERERGITTEYPLEGLSLKSALLKEGILTLEFNDPDNKTSGGSCRAGILWFQIEATAKQFPEVAKVRFLPEELFQP